MTRKLLPTGILILVIASLANKTFGQFTAASGGRAIGMAGTSLLLKDEFGLFNNPGALSAEQLSLLLSYNTRYIALGINDAEVGLVLPVGFLTTGLGLSYYGDALFNQLEITTSANHQVGFAQFGLRLGYQQFYLENYGYKRALVADIGGLFTLAEQFKLGMLITNLTRSKLKGQEDYRLTSLLALGLSYQPITSFRIDLQLTKDINLPVSGSLGIEYQLNHHVAARTGFNFTTSVAALGVGFQWPKFKLDLAGNYQPALGYSAILSILISRQNDD